MPDSKSYDLDHTATEKKAKTNITMVTLRANIFVFFHVGFKSFWKEHSSFNLGSLHVLRQVSFGYLVM